MADEQDPFEGLVLDEEFVRGGAYEAPARTRFVLAQVDGAERRRDAAISIAIELLRVPPKPKPLPKRSRRAIALSVVLLVVVLAVGGLGAAFLPRGGNPPNPKSGLRGAHPIVPGSDPSPSVAEISLVQPGILER